MIWFTGCTHFGHANIIKLAERPYGSVKEMDEVLIARWNATVKPNDTVYHLGDFAWKQPEAERAELFDRLKGRIVKIQGNHDPKHWGHDILNVNWSKRKFVLCHYPFSEWDGAWRGAIHLHAHTHLPDRNNSLKIVNKGGMCTGYRFNVGTDACGFAPISVDQIIDEARELQA